MKGLRQTTLGDISFLVEFAQEHPTWTHEDVETTFAWSHPWFQIILHHARQVLSGDGKYITCRPNPEDPWGPWLYRLTDEQPAVRDWSLWDLGRLETHLRSHRDAWGSQVEAKGLDTMEGLKAHRLVKDLDRALEDVADISKEAGITFGSPSAV